MDQNLASEISKEEKRAKDRLYMKEYRKKNSEKIKEIAMRYWERQLEIQRNRCEA